MNSNRLVGLISRFTLAVLCLVSFSSARSYSFDEARADIRRGANVAKEKIKRGVQYIFSRPGAKDLAAAYCVLMGSTLAHALGPALVGRAVYGIPVKIIVGAPFEERREPFIEVAGVGMVGLNPLKADWLRKMIPLSLWHPLKTAAMRMAGPVLCSLSSFYGYYLLKKHTQFPIAKFTALGCGLSVLVASKTRLYVSSAVNILKNYNGLLKLTEPYRNIPWRKWNMEEAIKVNLTLLRSGMM